MTLKDFADLATALTLIVAAVTFILAVIEHRQREREKRTQNWQKVVVYKIIEDGASDFDQIKVLYVTAAQQLLHFKLAKEEIQDDALRLALMTLVQEHLISKSSDTGGYLINAVSTKENELKEAMFAQFHKKMAENALISRLYQTLDADSGKFSTEQLYRTFEADKLGYQFADFDMLVREQIMRGGIVMNPNNQKLWLRTKVPTQQAPKTS